jgi:hypothetical protein
LVAALMLANFCQAASRGLLGGQSRVVTDLDPDLAYVARRFFYGWVRLDVLGLAG